MKTCPTCNSQVAVLIVNVQNGQHFRHHCASAVCPTFLPNLVLTAQDVRFMLDCGIDPQLPAVLMDVVKAELIALQTSKYQQQSV